jgi:putative addiction module killer protein
MLPFWYMSEIVIEEYIDEKGRSPFRLWFLELNAQAAAKITVAVTRMQAGNFSDTKSVGEGVFERTLDFGPGYRIYFGKRGEHFILLLAGGSKKAQSKDIAQAKENWKRFKSCVRKLQKGEKS